MTPIRDTFRLARRRLATAPAMCSNAARARSLDLEISHAVPARTRRPHMNHTRVADSWSVPGHFQASDLQRFQVCYATATPGGSR